MKLKSIMSVVLVAVVTSMVFVSCSNATTEPTKAKTGQLKTAVDAVKSELGEAYIPSAPIDEVMLTDLYGVPKDLVKEYIGEMPMISTHVDALLGIEAVEGKGEEVEAKLKEYKTKLDADTMQYPMNVPKIKASSVVRIDDYVFFVLLSGIDDTVMDKTEEEQLAHYQAENKKAVEIIKSNIK